MYRSVFIWFIHSLSCVLALYEGDACTNGGVCKIIFKCDGAIQALQKGVQPEICDFSKDVPIVCCAQNKPASPPTPVTRPLTTTTEYTPPEEVFEYVGKRSMCKPIRNFTAAATDRISWKMCLKYQEDFVFPCKVGPLGDKIRVNNCRHSANQLITGGVDAGEAEFPHMVMLSYSEDVDSFKTECGGTLISDWYILTAAHCTYKKNVGHVQYAATGALKQSTILKSQMYKIAERVQHRDYIANFHYHDIALLKTATRMKLDMFAVPACLDLGNDGTDAQALAIGWGGLNNQGDAADHLQKVVLKKFGTQECFGHFLGDRKLPDGFQESIQMCYGDKKQSRDACAGDSGGPLQLKLQRVKCMYSIIGITSFGRGCGTIGRPGVYTRVFPYVSWIEKIVWPNEV